MDGCLDAWDILYQQRAPLLSMKVSDEPLHTLKVHEAGCLVATGCEGQLICQLFVSFTSNNTLKTICLQVVTWLY